jgi:hypothetical protein
MKQVYKGNISKHGHTFCICAIVTQLEIKNRKPLFQVDFDNMDFNDNILGANDEENDLK